MKSPLTGKEMPIVAELRTVEIEGEKFKVLHYFYECIDTGEQFEDEDLALRNYTKGIEASKKTYVPYGEEWAKYLMRQTKKDIVRFLREVCLENRKLRKELGKKV